MRIDKLHSSQLGPWNPGGQVQPFLLQIVIPLQFKFFPNIDLHQIEHSGPTCPRSQFSSSEK